MEDRKEVSQKQVASLLWKHTHRQWEKGILGEYANSFEEYPEYLATILKDYFNIYKRSIESNKKK